MITKEELEKLYLVENKTQAEIAKICGTKNERTIRRWLAKYDIYKKKQQKEIIIDNKIKQDFAKKYSLTEKELKIVLDMSKNKPHQYETRNLPIEKNHIKFMILSDLHIGHKMYRPDVLSHAIRMINKEKIDFVCMPGDILEGMSGRDGHIYELNKIGATNQLNYAIEQLKKIRKPIYAITASNSHDGWYSSKGNIGYEIGPELERRVKNFHFLGYDEADLKLKSGLIIRMTHPGDATAYAISYKAQKYINSLAGGQKPHILIQGHYHKAMYMFYRNIHSIDAGTLCDQTLFMKKQMTPAHVGYWIIDAWTNKKGVDIIKPQFIPFWE
jgi:UDP-2,3-diacylglucosamine pyrophosphatase LpxH